MYTTFSLAHSFLDSSDTQVSSTLSVSFWVEHMVASNHHAYCYHSTHYYNWMIPRSFDCQLYYSFRVMFVTLTINSNCKAITLCFRNEVGCCWDLCLRSCWEVLAHRDLGTSFIAWISSMTFEFHLFEWNDSDLNFSLNMLIPIHEMTH